MRIVLGIEKDRTPGKLAGSRGKSGRLTEAQEDSMLLKSDDRVHRTTRLTVQPKCIENGTLRDYQLEVRQLQSDQMCECVVRIDQ